MTMNKTANIKREKAVNTIKYVKKVEVVKKMFEKTWTAMKI